MICYIDPSLRPELNGPLAGTTGIGVSGLPEGVVSPWDFESEPVPRWLLRQRLELFARTVHRAPKWFVQKTVLPKPTWCVYFVYCPDGALSAAHRFALGSLRDFGENILTVCAAKSLDRVPTELWRYSDALIWKGLEGYDFSAYSIALNLIARRSPDSEVLVINDSVFGPFTNARRGFAETNWGMGGFTASSNLRPHVQSYAFWLRRVNRRSMARFSRVFFPAFALSEYSAVIALQELRLAEVASGHLKVGAQWFTDGTKLRDLSVEMPFELLDAGLPFLKKSLLHRPQYRHLREQVLDRLSTLRHPLAGLI